MVTTPHRHKDTATPSWRTETLFCLSFEVVIRVTKKFSTVFIKPEKPIS